MGCQNIGLMLERRGEKLSARKKTNIIWYFAHLFVSLHTIRFKEQKLDRKKQWKETMQFLS